MKQMEHMATETSQSKEYLITSADVDFEAKIRISALVNFMIQSAWQHAEHLNWGVSQLLEHNLAWVLTGMKLELSKYPKWKESLTVETWPKGLNRLYYLRDFLVYDFKGNVIGKATSNWLTIDIDKRRPKVYSPYNLERIISTDKHAIAELIPSLIFEGEPDKKTEFEVRYSNIDINQHLTTTGYIDFVFDTLAPEFIMKNRPKSMTVNFLQEVVYGRQTCMLKKILPEDKIGFQLEPSDGGKPYFRCELDF